MIYADKEKRIGWLMAEMRDAIDYERALTAEATRRMVIWKQRCIWIVAFSLVPSIVTAIVVWGMR